MPTTSKINQLKPPVTPDKEMRHSTRNCDQLPTSQLLTLMDKSRRSNFLKESHIAQYKTYAELTFDINGSAKSSTTLQALLIQIVDKLAQFDPNLKVAKYKAEVLKSNAGFAVELLLVLKEVTNFVKIMRDFFFEIKTKGKDGGRVYTKCLLLHDQPFEDIAEMIKEEFSNQKLYFKK